MKRIEILSVAYLYILLISFLPLLVKGILHVQGGSYVPMVIINLIGLPLVFGLYYAKPWVTLFIKGWAVWLMVYGVVRLGLQLLISLMGGGVESNIIDQLTLGYLAMSVLHLGVGWCLNRYLYSCVWVAEKASPSVA